MKAGDVVEVGCFGVRMLAAAVMAIVGFGMVLVLCGVMVLIALVPIMTILFFLGVH